jgi:endogenous inhibitor of DNA gyrase (YacG/DUF329 family)
MPRHATKGSFKKGHPPNKTSFKKGQKLYSNGTPVGHKPKGWKSWNSGLKEKNDPRCKLKQSTKQKLHKLFEGRKMSWMVNTYKRGNNINNWTITKCKICNKKINHLKSEKHIYCSIKCRYLDKNEILKRAQKARLTNIKNGVFEKHRIRMKNGGALKALKRCKRISKWQREIYNKIKKSYSDTKLEYLIKTLDGVKAIDIYIPSLKLCIECDGDYWHKNRTHKDYIRQKAIEYLGYNVFRIKESEYYASNRTIPDISNLPKKSS